jgi:hypothetical protein
MNITSIKRCVVVGVVALVTGLSVPAMADRGWHGGGWHGGGWHGGGGGWHGGGWHGGGGWRGGGWWGLGVGLGLGYTAAVLSQPYYYYSSPTYYYPAYGYTYPPVQTVPVTTYPAQTSAVPTQGPSAADWYYCPSSKGYYPNVRTCRVAWQMVPATPPGAVR